MMDVRKVRSCRARDIYDVVDQNSKYQDLRIVVYTDKVVIPNHGMNGREVNGKGEITNNISQEWSKIIDYPTGSDDITDIEFGWADELRSELENDGALKAVSSKQSKSDNILPQTVYTAVVGPSALSECLVGEDLDNIKTILDSPKIVDCNQIQHRLEMLPVECIVRGYMCGSLWDEYKKGARVFCGNRLRDGYKESDKLDKPIFTPRFKYPDGHLGDNLTVEDMARKIGKFLRDLANPNSAATQYDNHWKISSAFDKYADCGQQITESLRVASLFYYKRAAELALKRGGIIIADTKFEFGINPFADDDPNFLMLGDEILTPESSKFWLVEDYVPGETMDRCMTDKEIYNRLFGVPKVTSV